ncbi:MAG TPA: coenzyme F420-0:L-glutamate ligase, partial [Bacillota bacterium]|nr:coenzyme F420-0:L-glutamate ligase [Bacillota bacterium]
MERITCTISRGLRAPIIRQGDNIADIVVNTVLKASESEGFSINDRDIVAVTESVVARAQGNFASIDDIAEDIKSRFGSSTIGVIFPIMSRNRFAICLKGIAKGAGKAVLMFNYPTDEVGNQLIDIDTFSEKNLNPWSDVLTEGDFRRYFGYSRHTFTGVDYIEYYKSIINEQGIECKIIFSNNPLTILKHTKNVLCCDIHTRARTKRILKENGGEKVYGLDDIMSSPVGGSGFN